jgi:hypothetical protein
MVLKEQIIKDLDSIVNLQLLNQLFEYIQIIKKTAIKIPNNRNKVLAFAGTIDEAEANELKQAITQEFNHIEGEW